MQIIDNTKKLKELCKRLGTCDFVAVDMEFIREKTYYPLLCLIQVASSDEAAVIDPLAKDICLDAFFDLMKNPKVTKVFHSCRQDVEIIYELGQIIPQPLFDTQVAAMVCGYGESISYERLVKGIFNVELDKTDRLSNWQLRPLDSHQLEYAIGDVTHLVKIYQHLLEKMKKNKRENWVNEEMQILAQEKTYVTYPQEAWFRIRHRSHNYKVLSALRDLAAWREQRAKNKNVPRQSIIKDEFLVLIASINPKNKEGLMNIRGMRKDVASGKLADEILKVLNEVKFDNKIVKELKQETYAAAPALVELFKLLLKIVSQKEGVVARLIANDTDLQKLAAGHDEENALLSGWRYEIFGKQAILLRDGKLNIHYNPKTKNIEFIVN